MHVRIWLLGIAVAGMHLAASSTSGEVLYQKRISDQELAQYELHVSSGYVDEAKLKQESAELIEAARKNPTVVKLELLRDPKENNRPYFKTTFLGEKLAVKAAKEKYWRSAVARLIIAKDIGKARLGSSGASWRGPADGFYEKRMYVGGARASYYGPGKGNSARLDIKEWVDEQFSPDKIRLDPQEFGRSLTRADFKFVTIDGMTVATAQEVRIGGLARPVASRPARPTTAAASRPRFDVLTLGAVRWQSGGNVIVGLSWRGKFPAEVVKAYLKKLPSTIPEGFALDKTAWARKEMDLWLGVMKKAVDAGDPPELLCSFSHCHGMIVRSVFVPFMYGPSRDVLATLADKKRRYQQIARWWKEHKAETVWKTIEWGGQDRPLLVARGRTPRELEAARRKARREAIERKLDEPIPPEKIKQMPQEAIKVFEARMRWRLAEYIRAMGAKHEPYFKKVREGVWEYQVGRRKVKYTYTGPKVVANKDRRRPFKAIFKGSYYDASFKRQGSADEIFYYDKLKDRWRW